MISANVTWGIMNDKDDSSGTLDSEFDHYLVDMKPYVLKLQHKTERQRCALWIKKLCDPVACGSGLTGRKNRNMYGCLLLRMLRKGVLEGPFAQKPEPGSLKTLPTYMSIYFDEPLVNWSLDQSSAALPDWVSGELGQAEKTWSTSPLSNAQRKRGLFCEKSPAGLLASSPLKHMEKSHIKKAETLSGLPISSDESDFETRFNSWNLGIENPRYLRENPVPLSPIYNKSSRNSKLCEKVGPVKVDKEIELKSKVLEAKHQEEMLRKQQKHDAEIQKPLAHGPFAPRLARLTVPQETVRRLIPQSLQSLLRESQVIRQTKEKQISELKKMSDQSAESQKNEWEKKLHVAVAEMEQEKFELQKKHTENIQELLEDTNQRLAKMEDEYNAQTHATEKMLKELEARVKQLSVEVENGNLLRQKVTLDKAELEVHITSISVQLQEANHRNVSLQREIEQMREQHEDTLQKLQEKHTADMSHFQQEYAKSVSKASEVIEDLEQMVVSLKQQIQDSEKKRQRQLREQETKMQQEMTDLQHSTDKKLQILQAELVKERADGRKRINTMEEMLRAQEHERPQYNVHAQNTVHNVEQGNTRAQDKEKRGCLLCKTAFVVIFFEPNHSLSKCSILQDHGEELTDAPPKPSNISHLRWIVITGKKRCSEEGGTRAVGQEGVAGGVSDNEYQLYAHRSRMPHVVSWEHKRTSDGTADERGPGPETKDVRQRLPEAVPAAVHREKRGRAGNGQLAAGCPRGEAIAGRQEAEEDRVAVEHPAPPHSTVRKSLSAGLRTERQHTKYKEEIYTMHYIIARSSVRY
ncbi:putative centrosomal protein of 112 kDa, partial [Triplophysa rosa]